MSLLVQTVSDGPAGTSLVVKDYANIVQSVEFTTQRFDTPGKLTFSCVEPSGISIAEGSAVSFSVDGTMLFQGYVFIAEGNKDGETTYTAYDQLRYLKANKSYSFTAMTLGQIIQQIAADFGLKVGVLADTGYAFPYLYKPNECCLNIIFSALSETIYRTGKIFVFYDNAGFLTLTEVTNMFTQTLLGDASLVTDYSYKRDIDSNTYNRVELVRANSQTGKMEVYVCEDKETIGKWGLLQYYDQVDENMNEAQIDQMCQQYLNYYNRVLQTITLESVGIPGIRAGSILPVRIDAVSDLSTTRLLLAEKVTHKFENDVHTMSIEVKNFRQFGGIVIV